jgi:hypothetical protein
MTGSCSWDEASADSRTNAELADAVVHLRRVLGEDWQGWKEGWPLATYFGMSFQNEPPEWVRLYRLVKALEAAPGTDALVRSDLGSSEWTEYSAAVMALEFCGRLRPSVRRVEFIETAGHLHPSDALVEIATRSLTVEFKALHNPDDMKQWEDLCDWVVNQLVARGGTGSGVDVECAPTALDEREALVEGLLVVQRERSPDWQPLARETGWARYTGLNVLGWRPAVRQRPELDRIIGKLTGKWWKKFRDATTPTLLVVRTGLLFGESPASVLAKAEAAAARLRETLESFQTIGAVLIYDEPLWPPAAPDFVETPTFRLATGAADGCARAVLVVTNPCATIPLTEEELQVLVGPRMLW